MSNTVICIEERVASHPMLKLEIFKPLINQAHKIQKVHGNNIDNGIRTFRKNIKRIRDRILDGKILRPEEIDIAVNDYFNDLTQKSDGYNAMLEFKKYKGLDLFDNGSAVSEFYKEYVSLINSSN